MNRCNNKKTPIPYGRKDTEGELNGGNFNNFNIALADLFVQVGE